MGTTCRASCAIGGPQGNQGGSAGVRRLAFDQWVQIRERLIATTKRFARSTGNRVCMAADRDIGVAPGAVLGLKPASSTTPSTGRTRRNRLWKTFWQNEASTRMR